MRVIFMGTPEFAVPSLAALAEAGHDLALVVTQPYRRGGRGGKMGPSPVREKAEELGLDVAEASSGGELLGLVREARAEVGAVAAYGRLVGPRTLAQPKHGCLAVHPSLLPALRGAAPIQRAIMAGLAETGVTVIQMTPAFDEGPILAQETEPVEPDETADSLGARLARTGARMLVETLSRLAENRLEPRPQDTGRVTLAPALTPEDEVLDFRRPAADLANRVRALNSRPVARTSLGGRVLKVWRAVPTDPRGHLEPGTVAGASSQGIIVACGDGHERLAFLEVQPAGGRPMSAADYARGQRDLIGSVLGGDLPAR